MNLALKLKITSVIHVPNMVKIGEKLRPLALKKEKISLLRKSVAMHAQFCALHKSVWTVNDTANASFIWEPMFQIW